MHNISLKLLIYPLPHTHVSPLVTIYLLSKSVCLKLIQLFLPFHVWGRAVFLLILVCPQKKQLIICILQLIKHACLFRVNWALIKMNSKLVDKLHY